MARYAALVDGRFATGWGEVRAIIGSKTFELYSSLIAAGSGASLFDYLTARLGAIIVSNKVPAVDGTAQKAIAVRAANAPVSVDVWSGMGIRIDDPYSAAGSGKRKVTLSILVGSPFVPHTNRPSPRIASQGRVKARQCQAELIRVAGPAGSGKSQVARQMLESGEADLVADTTAIYAAL